MFRNRIYSRYIYKVILETAWLRIHKFCWKWTSIIKILEAAACTLLGAPLNDTALPASLLNKIHKIKTLVSRTPNLQAHTALFLLKNSLSIPELVYLNLRLKIPCAAVQLGKREAHFKNSTVSWEKAWRRSHALKSGSKLVFLSLEEDCVSVVHAIWQSQPSWLRSDVSRT
jgi:hypothetical protein